MKIVFFGDSLTQGMFGAGFFETVRAALPSHELVNKGVNGDTSLNLFRRVTPDVIDLKPAGVVIMVGVNDAITYVEPRVRLFYRLFKRLPAGQIAPIAFRENMRATLNKLIFAGIKIWVVLPPIETRPEAASALRIMNDHLAELCREHSIPYLDLFAQMTPAHIPARPPSDLSVMSRNFLILIGIRPFERLRKAGGYTYSFDGLHLTPSGAGQMADAITAFLRANGVT
jgi:lysophospholipase L1-like esterase